MIVGIDPGARYVGVASTDDTVIQPHVIDLGPLGDESLPSIVHKLSNMVAAIAIDDRVLAFGCEKQLDSTLAKKPAAVTTRLIAVQTAIQTMCYCIRKRFIIISPRDIKLFHKMPTATGDHAVNKKLAVDKCVELYGDAYREHVHHVCDAKLVATAAEHFLSEDQLKNRAWL